jgi:hypothetical protein
MRMKTTTGASLLAVLFLAFAAVTRSEPRNGSYALIVGTVFRDSGLSLPSAELTLTQTAAPEGARKKMKPLRAVSDARGEFAFRVPTLKAGYTVEARAPGFVTEKKEVTIGGDERVDVYFRLKPADEAKR